MTNPFIVFEGVDGSGKSDVSRKVATKINAIHHESPITPFREIRGYADQYLSEEGRFLFYLASNIDISRRVQEDRQRKPGICARYIYSTLLGYVSRKNLPIHKLWDNIPVAVSDFIKPDMTIFLSVNAEIQRTRINARNPYQNTINDHKVINNTTYRETLMRNYSDIARMEKWHIIETSNKEIEEVIEMALLRIRQG